jgi:hypothetical protein
VIESLGFNDCREAYLEIQRPVGMKLAFDQGKIDYLLRVHRALLATTAGQDEHLRVLESATQLTLVAAGLDMLGGDLDCRFGLTLTDVWLSRNGYLLLSAPLERTKLFEVLTLVPALPDPPSDGQLNAVRSWAAANIIETASGATLGEKSGLTDDRRPIRCFVACPLTGVPSAEKEANRSLCDAVASVLGEYGILTIQPVLYTLPGVASFHIDDPVYRSIDEFLIAESEIVVVLAARTSCGLGVVAATAQRYRKQLIFASPAAVVTPMIRGLDPTPTVLRWSSIEDDLRAHIDTSLPAIEAAAARGRQAIADIADELARLRLLLAERSVNGLDNTMNIVMNPARLRELLNCPALFAGATVLEIRELYALAGE